MTIIEAITKVDTLKPNAYSTTDKISWLSRLDGMVKRLIIDTHEGGEDVIFSGYDSDTDMETELLVAAPFDDIYLRWLEAQIDYSNAEFNKYNNSILMFNSAFDVFSNYYNRNHMPATGNKRFVF
jgi:hypothetical protein